MAGPMDPWKVEQLGNLWVEPRADQMAILTAFLKDLLLVGQRDRKVWK